MRPEKKTPIVTHILKQSDSDIRKPMELIFDMSLLSDPNEHKTIQEALNGPDRRDWLDSAKNEAENFLHQKSWEFVDPDEGKRRLSRDANGFSNQNLNKMDQVGSSLE